MKVKFHKSPVLDIQWPRYRSKIVLVCLLLGFLALFAKAMHVQIISNDFLQKQGEKRYERNIDLLAVRGKIFDRTGKVVLASSVPAKAIWAIPEDAKKIDDASLIKLAKLIEISPEHIRQLIAGAKSNFVYLKHQVSLDVAKQIADLKINGIHEQRSTIRIYPEAEVLSHLIGFTDIKDVGQEGIELAFNDVLSGKPGSRKVIKDRLGSVIDDIEAVIPAIDGKDLNLSIDVKIQFELFDNLKNAMLENKAKAAAGVVLDVETGEILALANFPSYNPNRNKERVGGALRNTAVVDTFEMGSILKPFTAAIALQNNKINKQTKFNTGNGKYSYQGAVISDVSKNGVVNVSDILKKSSNIGMTMISEQLSSEEMWDNFNLLGFGNKPQTQFPGVASGRLRPWNTWRPIERATMAYGYGISASLLQIAHAYTAIARNGDLVSLSLTKRDSLPTSKQVYNPEIAADLREMLYYSVGTDGTHLASVPGYSVGGKSGTARKIINNEYSNKAYHSSYVGFAPVNNPKIIVAIMIDEPRSGAYYGGRVAAPVFASVTGSALKILGIKPDVASKSLVAIGDSVGGVQ